RVPLRSALFPLVPTQSWCRSVRSRFRAVRAVVPAAPRSLPRHLFRYRCLHRSCSAPIRWLWESARGVVVGGDEFGEFAQHLVGFGTVLGVQDDFVAAARIEGDHGKYAAGVDGVTTVLA